VGQQRCSNDGTSVTCGDGTALDGNNPIGAPTSTIQFVVTKQLETSPEVLEAGAHCAVLRSRASSMAIGAGR